MRISLNNISKSFGSDLIFSEVSAKIEDHDRVGLVGINGAGKTTLLKVICGEEDIDSGEIARGSELTIGYQKQNCGLMQESTIREEMRSVFADVYEMEAEMHRLREEMAHDPAALERYKLLEDAFLARDGYQVEVKINRVLTGMGFTENGFDQSIAKLSGGEQTRLAIAKLLLESPSLLVLDEPTNHLDFKTLAWLEEYLSSYSGAILIVSHDRYFLDKLCTKVWELEDAELREYKGNYSAYTRQREEQDARQRKLLAAQMEERAKLTEYVEKNLVRASTTKMAQSRRKQLEKMEPVEKPHRRLKPPKLHLEYETEPVKDVLSVEGMTLTVGEGDRTRTLLRDVEFTVHRGDKIAIIGGNGAGKTTLIRAILREGDSKGRVRWGRGVRSSYFDQGSDSLDQNLTVLDTMWKAYPRLYETVLRSTLGSMGLTGEDAFLRVSQLSGGERARLKLAIICLAGSNVLILDEPTNHLDLQSKEVLQEALSEYTGTLIIVSHDRYLLDRVPTRIFSLEDQVLHQYPGKYSDYLRLSAEERNEKPAAPKAEKVVSEQTKLYNKGKEQRRLDARRRKDYAETEAKIAALDEEQEEIRRFMDSEEVREDYQRLQELCSRTEEIVREQETLMEHWLTLSEELGRNE